jgi:hypothetical protein
MRGWGCSAGRKKGPGHERRLLFLVLCCAASARGEGTTNRLRRAGTTNHPFVSLSRLLSIRLVNQSMWIVNRSVYAQPQGSHHLTSPTGGEGPRNRLRRVTPAPNLSHPGGGNRVSAAPIVLYGTSAGRGDLEKHKRVTYGDCCSWPSAGRAGSHLRFSSSRANEKKPTAMGGLFIWRAREDSNL